MFRVVREGIRSTRLRAPSPALVVSLIALFTALGGSAYAVWRLPTNSVGTRQLKNGAVTEQKLSNNAVMSAKVKDRSLLARDFKRGQLPAGPQGPKGDPGVSGATTVVMRTGADFTIARLSYGGGAAYCHAGEKASGGGVYPVTSAGYPPMASPTYYPAILASYPLPNSAFGSANDGVTPTGWEVWVSAPQSAQTVLPDITMTPYVICASP